MNYEEFEEYRKKYVINKKFKNSKELAAHIDKLVKTGTDYNSTAENTLRVLMAVHDYMADKVGLSMFQGGWITGEFLRITRYLTQGFMIVDGEHFLYPQYDIYRDLEEFRSQISESLVKRAKELISEDDKNNRRAHPRVRLHWEKLANGYTNR